MKHLLTLCLLLTYACGFQCASSINEVINCYPCDRCSPKCSKLSPRSCTSGHTINCNCCDVCLVYLNEGEQCKFYNYPKNVQCHPGLICGPQGKCVKPPSGSELGWDTPEEQQNPFGWNLPFHYNQ